MNTTKKLRLGPLPKTETVKLTFNCPANLKVDLDRYAAVHAQAYGEGSGVSKGAGHCPKTCNWLNTAIALQSTHPYPLLVRKCLRHARWSIGMRDAYVLLATSEFSGPL